MLNRRPLLQHIMLASLLCAALPAHAQIYKCTENGKTIYTDKPCRSGGETIEIRNAPSSSGSRLADDNMASLTEDLARDRRRSQIDREIRERQDKIASLQAALNKELEDIQYAKRFANNNLAGAMWRQSMSSEQEAKVQNYNMQIEAEQKAIDRLIDVRNSL